MCSWLHSDLKGYRDQKWSWTALAEGEWSHTGPALRGRTCSSDRDVRLGEELGSPPFATPTSTTPTHPSYTWWATTDQIVTPPAWQELGALMSCGRDCSHWWGISGNLQGGHRQPNWPSWDLQAGLNQEVILGVCWGKEKRSRHPYLMVSN